MAFTLRTHRRFLSRAGTGSDLYLHTLLRARLPSGEWATGQLGRQQEAGEEGTAAVLAGDEGAGLGWRGQRVWTDRFWICSESGADRASTGCGRRGKEVTKGDRIWGGL